MYHNVRMDQNLGMDHNVNGSQIENTGHNLWPRVIKFSFIYPYRCLVIFIGIDPNTARGWFRTES